MKLNQLRPLTLLLAVGLVAVAGCSSDSASASADAPSSSPTLFQPQPEVIQPAPAPVAAVEPQGLPPQKPLAPPVISRNVADIAQLAKSGVSERLMLTFVQNTRTPFALGATEIIYLNDVGVSETVLDAMLRHDRELGVSASAQPASVSTVVVQQPAAAPEPTTVIVVQEPAPVSVNYFYENLSPYGSWIEVDGYGRCWQPAVVVQQPDWRPYCDRGHWSYTSCGWYWESDYSWGATFHYGRWFHHARRGWCWVPDTSWGPAWVSWRDSADYCGWAPLPPTACYRPGVGFTYRNENVSVSFGFDLGAECFTFVPRNHFGHDRPQNHAVPVANNTQIINNTTVVNNYVTGNNNTVINQGLASPSVPASAVAAQNPALAPHFANPRGHQDFMRQPAVTAAAVTPAVVQPLAAPVAHPPTFAPQTPAIAPVVAPAVVTPSVKNPRLQNWPATRPNLPVRATPQLETPAASVAAPVITQPASLPVKASPAPIHYQNLAPVRHQQVMVEPVAQPTFQPVVQTAVQPSTPAATAVQNWQAAAENFRQQHPNLNLPTRNYTPPGAQPVAQPAPIVRAQPQSEPVVRQPPQSQPAPVQTYQSPVRAYEPSVRPQPVRQAEPVMQPATPVRQQPQFVPPQIHNAEDVRRVIGDAIQRGTNGRR
ncbi:MAG: hypothetical protein RLZZ350_86 [Verrucomicrobiota bacterium]